MVDRDTGVGSVLLNMLWLMFAGWWLALHHIVLAVGLAVTIIGIPFAWQHVKLAMPVADAGRQGGGGDLTPSLLALGANNGGVSSCLAALFLCWR